VESCRQNIGHLPEIADFADRAFGEDDSHPLNLALVEAAAEQGCPDGRIECGAHAHSILVISGSSASKDGIRPGVSAS
jgi:hypothetical protein